MTRARATAFQAGLARAVGRYGIAHGNIVDTQIIHDLDLAGLEFANRPAVNPGMLRAIETELQARSNEN